MKSKSKKVILSAILLAQLAAYTALFAGESMRKLINISTQYVIVEFSDDKPPLFQDKYLEAMFKDRGIVIPPALVSKFQNKEAIHLDDPLFKKAF